MARIDQKKEEWIRYLDFSQPWNGLFGIYEQGGEGMLSAVLKELKIGTPVELVKWMHKREIK